MEFTYEVNQVLASVSKAQLDFAQYAAAHPDYLDRSQFKALEEKHCAITIPIQSWPTLVGANTLAEMERVSVGLCRLIKRIPDVIFDFDAEAMSEFYHLDLSFIQHFVVPAADDQVFEGAMGRGDFIKTADGLWCIEFNVASNLAGIWEAAVWQQKMMSIPLITDYLGRNNIAVRYRNSFDLQMQHVIQQANKRGLANEELNVAYVFLKEELENDPAAGDLKKYFHENYVRVLGESGPARHGTCFICSFDELSVADGCVFAQGKRVHAIVECIGGDVPLHILRCHQLGTLNLHNGPVTYVLCNKLNMALLSEFQNSEIFSEEEQELVRRHIPWTRKVVDSTTDFEGTLVALLDFIRENKDMLVLKKSISRSGEDVVPGHCRTQVEWEKALAWALEENNWIVQKYVPCPPLPYQHGDYGCCPHDVVWGLFVFGEIYGGTFLRVLPKGKGSVVNRPKGAFDAIVLEVD